MGNIPVPVPLGKPAETRTRPSGVRVWAGTGTGRFRLTHGLPVSITNDKQSAGNQQDGCYP